MNNQVLLSKLLVLRAKGYNLIPLRGGEIGNSEYKRPLIPWLEYQKRRSTVDELKKWVTQTGTFGIVTGPISNLLVVDVDVKDSALGAVPGHAIPTARGSHIYTKWIPELHGKVTTGTKIAENVDIRGEGGYVVAWSTELPNVATLAAPTKVVMDLLPNKQREVEGVRYQGSAIERLGEAEEGNRNERLFKAAASLRDKGLKPTEIFTILKPTAVELDYPMDELALLCGSAGRYEPKNQVDESVASSIEEFLKDQEKVEWICEGLIAKKSIGFIVGLPETGKTWAMIDLAIQCARGDGLWLNKFPVKKQKVLFIDQERFRGETQRRFKALLSPQQSSTEISTNLYIKSGTSIRLNLQHSFDAFKKELSELRPDLVIIDSFATFHLAEENNRKDIQVVLERVKELRNEFGCTFMFISHENKFAFDKESGDPSIAQMAGSIAIPAAAETVLTVRKNDSESSMIYHTKSTLASTHEPFLIKIVDCNPQKTSIKIEAY